MIFTRQGYIVEVCVIIYQAKQYLESMGHSTNKYTKFASLLIATWKFSSGYRLRKYKHIFRFN